MTVLVSLVFGVLFASGVYLMLKRDLIRVITGVILLGNAANLFIMSAGLSRGGAPLVSEEGPFADSLVQAMTLTAVVISFGVASLVLAVVYRVYDSHRSVDMSRISSAEAAQAAEDDRIGVDDPGLDLDAGSAPLDEAGEPIVSSGGAA
jgi:multicomponent Na+:H+ antiporter subunit C